MRQYSVGSSFERITIDIASSFLESNQGNQYFPIGMNYFRKCPEAYSLPNQEAETVIVLNKNWISRFGVLLPLQNKGEQGRNFGLKQFQELCKT